MDAVSAGRGEAFEAAHSYQEEFADMEDTSEAPAETWADVQPCWVAYSVSCTAAGDAYVSENASPVLHQVPSVAHQNEAWRPS